MNLRIELEWRTVLQPRRWFLTCYLGFGVSRADEKRDLLSRFEERANEPALSLPRLRVGAELADRRVQFSALADGNRYLLLDNRLRDGRLDTMSSPWSMAMSLSCHLISGGCPVTARA